MKQKGITVIEQHVEKLVLLAAVGIALFFGALQFLGEGNTSDFNGTKVPAVRLDNELVKRAMDIQGRLSNEAPSTYSEPERNIPSEEFVSKLKGSISPGSFGIPPQYAMAPESGLSADSDKEYLIPKPVAMSTPMVDQHVDALHEDEVAALTVEHNDFLNDIFGNLPETYDISWTTPYAMVDWNAVREQLSVEDSSGEKLGIPNHWYRDRVFAFNLKIERETEQDDGGWSELTIIESLPLKPTLKEYIEKEDLSGIDKDIALDWLEVQINQASIIQPQFFNTKGDYWSFPVMPVERDKDAGEEMEGIFDLQDEIARIEGKLSRLRAVLKRLEEREDEDRGTGGGGIGPGGGGGGGIGGGGGGLQPPGGGGGGGSDPNRPTGIKKKIENLEKQIEIQVKLLESKKEALEALALELGIDLDEEILQYTLVDLEKDDISLVWGHDITVIPGETYRYRFTLQIYNPFFDKEPVLVESQKVLAKSLVMDVQTSEWSEPISINERTRFFVTRAIPENGDTQRVGRATVEVYHIYDGSWFQEKYDVMPGDPIGQMGKETVQDEKIDINFATNFFILDILKRPADRNSNSGQMKGAGKVVIATPDGEIIIRDPELDSKNPERIKLVEYSKQG